MKTQFFARLLPLVAAVTAQATLQAHEFTDLQGRKLDAEIVAVSAGQATLKRTADNRLFTLPVASFSAPDQKLMNEFAAANLSYKFDINHTKKKMDSVTKKISDVAYTTETWAFKVEMRNRQPVELQNLRVDYWLFRKQDEGRGAGTARVATSGTHKIESVKGSAVYIFDTLPLELNKTKLEGNFIYIDGTRPRSADTVGGIVLRVFDPNGREVFKYATEEDLYAAAAGKTQGSTSNDKPTVGKPK